MLFKRKRKEAPRIPRNRKVPPGREWAAWGIVGEIALGPRAGRYVLADPFRDEAGNLAGYVLYLPDGEDLQNLDGTHLMPDDTFDEERADGSGGFIDEITNALGITWTADPARVERIVREQFAYILGPNE